MRSARRLLPLALLLSSLGACSEGREIPEPLAAGTDAQAREVIERFFSAYIAADAPKAVELICERDPESRAQAQNFILNSQAPGSRFRVQSFEVRGVEPDWAHGEPLFQVEVAFPRGSGEGEMVHRYRVRAKDGCVAQFLGGAPPPRAPQVAPHAPPAAPAEPPSEPPAPAAPEAAPVDPGDEVIEL